MKLRLFSAIALSVCAALPAEPVNAKTVALLIGVSTYQDRNIPPLTGVAYDVPGVETLLRTKMQAAPQDIHKLIDEAATYSNIVAELRQLKQRSAPGDTVVIYFSGHGTSARAEGNDVLRLPLGTSAFIPYDFDLANRRPAVEQMITGRLHLLPLALKPLDDGGRNVILIADSCYSGNIVRSVNGVTSRYLPIGDGEPSPRTLAEANVEAAPYPYRRVVMISASADTEKAADLSNPKLTPTLTGKPQGALTDALIGAFDGKIATDYNGDGKVSFVELQRAIRESLAERKHLQSPQILPSIDQDPDGVTFGEVPGLVARPVAHAQTQARIVVATPNGAADLIAALRQTSDFTVGETGAEFSLARGAGPNLFNLRNRAGDIIVADVPLDAVFERLRAGAWASRIVARAQARIDVFADTQPVNKGGSFVIGQDKLRLAVKADKSVHYLVVNVDPKGRLVTLWPTSRNENVELPARTLRTIPDAPIAAADPAGLDHAIVLAFAEPPPGVDQWYDLNSQFGSAQGIQFTQWLAMLKTPYAATSLDIRTIPASAGVRK
ncbi:MAG: hypothetical protein C0500_08445 [Sphingobium sp.]|nr:hypothetical protein [Sphingobium sp.]